MADGALRGAARNVVRGVPLTCRPPAGVRDSAMRETSP
jgi:hypothetical protein